MAEPTPPLPTTSALLPFALRPRRCMPRTNPAPSNMSASRLPSGRLSNAFAAPAMVAVGVTSSARLIVVTLCGIVTTAPHRDW